MKLKPIFTVSDHAMLRYLERTGRIDRAALEKEILSDRLVDAMKVGAATYKVDGLTFILKRRGQDCVVVTVLDNVRQHNTARDPDLIARASAL